jgi:glycosyltransferase involved in cell wall biosynthesis
VHTYYVIVTCRNSEKDIETAILSIFNQSIAPAYIIVIDDGSTDRTPHILSKLKEKLSNLHVITNPDLGYDIGRIVSNWNKAIRLTYEKGLEKTDFHMIATDDTVYEENYAKNIFMFINENPQIVISSGNYDQNNYVAPHGAGRFVNNDFFEKYHKFYPEIMGYESFILHAARKEGYGYAIAQNARFKHTRMLGIDHGFKEFGASMRALGYHPLFVLSKLFFDIIKNKPIGRFGTLSILYYYLTYRPNKNGYNSFYQQDVRDYIRKTQLNHFRNKIKRLPRNIVQQMISQIHFTNTKKAPEV